MKKIALSLMAAVSFCYSNFIFSETLITTDPQLNWSGFYLGANAGYWRSQTNKITTTGSTSFIKQSFELGASNIANALTQMANVNSSLHSNGFIGGAQGGYNYESNKGVLLGLVIDLDGLSNSNNTFTSQRNINLLNFNESYAGSLAVKQKLNYLGTVRARLGLVYCPNILVYATGGFAYGNVTLNTAWYAQESLGPTVFPPIITQHNLSKSLTGWTAGAGIEWLFKPNWSALIEYTYYSLNDLNGTAKLEQINKATSPAVLWGSATAHTALSLSMGAIKLGVNYHFL